MEIVKEELQLENPKAAVCIPPMRWKVDLTWTDWDVKSEVDIVRLLREDEGNIEVDQQLTTVSGQYVTRDDRALRQLKTFTTHRRDESVIDMVSYHNNLFVIHNGYDKLSVYDHRGSLKNLVAICSKTNEFQILPTVICLVRGDRDTYSLVISDCGGKCLWWLTTEKKAGDVKLGQSKQHKVDYFPFVTGTDMSGRAVVTGNRYVYVYSHPGQHVTCLQLPLGGLGSHVLGNKSGGYVIVQKCNMSDDDCDSDDAIRSDHLVWMNSAGQVTGHYTDQPALIACHIVDNGAHLLASDPENHCGDERGQT